MATQIQIDNFIDNLYLAAGGDVQRVAAFAWTGLITTELAVAAFDGSAELYGAFLERAKLETELAQLQSLQRIAEAARSTANATADAELAALNVQIAEKLAEIDAL